MLTNVVRVKFNQKTNPVVHIYRIEIKPNVQENCKDPKVIEYINMRLTEILKNFVHVKKGMIATSE
jgi:hypothetical protein